LNRTLIAVAARHVVNTGGLLAVRRPDLSWTTYVAAGGPVLAKR
jgi:hypothetical protein